MSCSLMRCLMIVIAPAKHRDYTTALNLAQALS
jgi:hypothetical protein